MNKELPLLTTLLEYEAEKNVAFSMPGNKAGEAFKRDIIGKNFMQTLGRLDITEVDPLDNLHSPEGVIKEAQEKLKKLYRCKKAYFIVNGSTGGILSSMFSAFEEGDEVLVERNCHRAVYNGLVLRKLKVTYIEPVICEDGYFLPPDKNNIYKALKKTKNPKGIILTYPNYFGISYDIKEIVLDMKERGLKVIIDEAHGAHYGITDKLPISMASYGDYVISSAHKTLPALTGGSFLFVNDENEKSEFFISAFMTTSPSYLIMASLDYARYYLEKYGKEDYDKLIEISNCYKNKINNLGKVKIVDNEDLPHSYEIDKSRYLIVLPKGYSGHKLLDYLREENIQAEMSFSSGVVLLLSYCNCEEGLSKLYDVINNLDIEKIRDVKESISFRKGIPNKKLEPWEVFNFEDELCLLEEGEGRIVKEAIVPYPPGIPIISCGEVLTKELINDINSYLISGNTVLGIKNKKIKVIKNNQMK